MTFRSTFIPFIAFIILIVNSVSGATGQVAFYFPADDTVKYACVAVVTLGYKHGVVIGDKGGVYPRNGQTENFKIADLEVLEVDPYLSYCNISKFASKENLDQVVVKIETTEEADTTKFAVANSAYAQEDYEKALWFYSQIDETSSTEYDELVCRRIDTCTSILKRLDETVLSNEEINNREQKIDIYLKLAILFFMNGEYQPAYEFVDRILTVNPSHKEAKKLSKLIDDVAGFTKNLISPTPGINCKPEKDDELPASSGYIPCEKPAQMIKEVTPVYPADALYKNIEGELWVQALIDKKGRVRRALVRRSSGYWNLDYCAVVAAYKNKYKPAVQNGKPVAMWVTYKVEFVM